MCRVDPFDADLENMHIVIVDNGSGNGSEEWLVEHFIDEKRVRVIASGENLGFARGNNLGIRYAREHYDPDLIVAANSDILFEQPDFCERLFEIYDRKPYAILGADVVDATRTQHFNPVAEKRSYTLNYMRKQILSSWIRAMSYRMSRLLLGKKNGGDLSRSTGATREVDGEAVAADSRVGEEREGVLLHGCCLVFQEISSKCMTASGKAPSCMRRRRFSTIWRQRADCGCCIRRRSSAFIKRL